MGKSLIFILVRNNDVISVRTVNIKLVPLAKPFTISLASILRMGMLQSAPPALSHIFYVYTTSLDREDSLSIGQVFQLPYRSTIFICLFDISYLG